MINENFVILGALLNLAGSLSYLTDVLKGKAKPNRVSWILWSLAPMIAFAGELGEGVGIRSLMTFMTGFSPMLVVIASFINKKAYWQISRFDMLCGGLSIIGLILWLVTSEGFFAILFAILADGLAAIPTVAKSFNEPESENYHVFLGGAISAVIALLTIDHWYFANWGFPAYILFICGLLIVLIRFKVGEKFKFKLPL